MRAENRLILACVVVSLTIVVGLAIPLTQLWKGQGPVLATVAPQVPQPGWEVRCGPALSDHYFTDEKPWQTRGGCVNFGVSGGRQVSCCGQKVEWWPSDARRFE